MRTALAVLTDELRRLKSAGVKTVPVREDTIALLKKSVGSQPRPAVSGLAVAGGADSGSLAQRAGLPPTPVVAAKPAAAPAPEPKAPPAPKLPPPPPFTLPAGGTKQTRWDALYQHVMADPVCKEHVRPGKKIVLGVGTLEAKILFVGEAPGAEEEVQGEPFVGPAGQLLTKMIQAMGLQRGDVYIGNIMNWRPELPVGPGGVQYGNRPPTPDELAYCLPYLKAQIEIVNPAYLVALGATAAHGLLGPGAFKALGEVRGRWRDFAGRPLMITYHPSYILRNPTNRSKRMIWDDLLQVMEKAGIPISDKQRGFFLDNK